MPPKLKKAENEASPTEKRKQSPARNRSPGRGRPKSKSPSRVGRPTTREKSKSPSRTKVDIKSLKKSPERTAGVVTPTRRSPIRRSPARSPARKLTTEEKETKIPAISSSTRGRKQKIVIETDTDSDTGLEEKPEIKEKPKAAVRGRTRMDFERDQRGDQVELKREPSEESTSLLRRITRSSQSKEVERIVHLKQFENSSKKLGEFSDEDELHLKPSSERESSERRLPPEFGGTVGTGVGMLFFPVFTTWLLISCNEYQCQFSLPKNLKTFASVQAWFDLKSFLIYCGYFLFLATLSALPFGGRKVSGLPNKHQKLTYVMNGLFSFVIIISIVIGLEVKNVPVTEFLIDHVRQLFVSSAIMGLFLSIFSYVRSFYVPISALNTHAVGKSGIYNFVMGREVNPRVFGIIDMKLFVLRLVSIGMLLVDFSFMYRSLGLTMSKADPQDFHFKSLNFQPTVLVYFILHALYTMDGMIFEHTWVTSFENQQEGFGYMMAVGYSVYPFMCAAKMRYLVDYGTEIAPWKLALIVLVNIVGYVFFRGSNSQKDAFRKNPYSPRFAHVDAIPTTQGKKLLCSGFWGIVRHPNYLGDILINLSFVPFLFAVPPVLVLVMTIFFLIHRTQRDHIRCKQKYGAAWDRYCSRVKYVLVPKVY